jgi:uncharacterized protein YrrD
MLNKANALKGYTLDSIDGEIGKVKEFYFDDRYWTIRYLVADTGNWLVGRKVLISPHPLLAVNKEEQKIGISLTKKQIEDSPSLDDDKPVSRQFEKAYYGYYGWPIYWAGSFMWGSSTYPYMAGPYPGVAREREELAEAARSEKAWDPHLRSTHDVAGRHIEAADGEIGHIEDFIIDDKTWAIRYLIIDTRNWWPGKRVLVAPQWIESVGWSESKVLVNLSRDAIKRSPQYTEESLLTRDYETGLHQHYNREGYWVNEPASKECDEQSSVQPDKRSPTEIAQIKNPVAI